MNTTDPLRGVLHFFLETGYEGSPYAFQDAAFITKNTTRFTCSICHRYWDKSRETREALQERIPKSSADNYCAINEHDFQLASEETWSYEGLHIIRPGDHLTIYNKEGNTVLWSGIVDIPDTANRAWTHEDTQRLTAWVESLGIDPKTWASWFVHDHPALLRKAV